MRQIFRRTIAQALAAALAGAIIGLAVYAISRLTGGYLYIVLGALAGAAAALIAKRFWRTAQLSEVKITIPQFSELTFVVNNDARQAAWKFYIETVTRISTQSLADGEGIIREALTSLYSLFGTIRATLEASRPSVADADGQTVENLAITMLNRELRPFLSKWHPRLREFEQAHPGQPESAWPDDLACRGELVRVQAQLAEFAIGFGRLAGVTDAQTQALPSLPAGAP